MEQIKNIIKWIGTDGLLHFLVCYAMMLALSPIVGWALLVALVSALATEAWDCFVEKNNNKEQLIHDLICDAVGIVAAYITLLVWQVIIL